MTNYLISADSTCDLSPELIRENHIRILPLHVQMGETNSTDGVDVQPEDLYAYVSATGDLPKTQAINVDDYIRFFEEASRMYDFVIHINISADFSSCYQNACLAAKKYANVYVVDSRNLSTGHGHVVMEAVRLAREGEEPEKICEKLKEFSTRVDASFILQHLEYLRKGGRCSSVAALGANILKLRPCIEVKDGKMGVGKKYRGRYEQCILDYIRDRLENLDEIDDRLVFITHSGLPADQEKLAYDAVVSLHKFKQVIVTHAGCTVCSHCGPSTIGVLFVRCFPVSSNKEKANAQN